jgi:hypothetical protein
MAALGAVEVKLKVAEAEIRRLGLKPGEVLVAKVDEDLDQEELHALFLQISPLFPDNKVLVVDRNITFEAVDGGAPSVAEQIAEHDRRLVADLRRL